MSRSRISEGVSSDGGLTGLLTRLGDVARRADALARRHGLRADVDTLADPTPLAHESPARQPHRAAALITGSVLAESAIEHHRGDFRKRRGLRR